MKYFNKNFFKFTFGFLVIVAGSLLLIGIVSAHASAIEKISFITDPQSIPTGTLSGPITIQAQDSSGSSLQTQETIDLEFLSSSPTGEFLGSSGSPATKTMNKNTANRTFYYRDYSSGNFIITVIAKGRDSGREWITKQNINVGLSSQGEVLGVSTSGNENDVDKFEGSSTSGPTFVNYSTPSSSLEVVFGKDRLTSVGSPISFQAFIKKNTYSNNNTVSFDWSFGDGYVGSGALVSHTYKYPGDYVVVLNSKSGNNFSTSRVRVKVVEPEIMIVEKEKFLEIWNNSPYEINLFKWKVVSFNKGFVFQPDTIILPNSKILVDKNLLTMKGEVGEVAHIVDSIGNVVSMATNSYKDILKQEEMKHQLDAILLETNAILDKAILNKLVIERSPTKTLVAQPIEEDILIYFKFN